MLIDFLQTPHADPLDLPLMKGPGPVLFITAMYLLVVLKLGKWFMENRQPYELRGILKVYNLGQVVFNSSFVITTITVMCLYKPYRFSCITPLPLDHPGKFYERLLGYCYYMNKYADMLDTVFFVLRKKYKQITVLHIVHHAGMPAGCYLILRQMGYGGYPMTVALANTFVHAVMYTYYYLASQYPNVSKSLWWKKYITILQLVQFISVLIHMFWTYLQDDCNVPSYVYKTFLACGIFLISMFTNFYIKTYVLAKAKRNC